MIEYRATSLADIEKLFRQRGRRALDARQARQSKKLNDLLTLEANVWFDAADILKATTLEAPETCGHGPVEEEL